MLTFIYFGQPFDVLLLVFLANMPLDIKLKSVRFYEN